MFSILGKIVPFGGGGGGKDVKVERATAHPEEPATAPTTPEEEEEEDHSHPLYQEGLRLLRELRSVLALDDEEEGKKEGQEEEGPVRGKPHITGALLQTQAERLRPARKSCDAAALVESAADLSAVQLRKAGGGKRRKSQGPHEEEEAAAAPEEEAENKRVVVRRGGSTRTGLGVTSPQLRAVKGNLRKLRSQDQTQETQTAGKPARRRSKEGEVVDPAFLQTALQKKFANANEAPASPSASSVSSIASPVPGRRSTRGSTRKKSKLAL